MIIFAVMGKGYGDNEDSFDMMSAHASQAGADAAIADYANSAWSPGTMLDGEVVTKAQYIALTYIVESYTLRA